jgi:hypothetical protein
VFDIAKPHLGTFTFHVFGIPVSVSFDVPITAGLDLDVTASGTVEFSARQLASAHMEATCTIRGCTAAANFQPPSLQDLQSSGNVNGRIKPSIWAQAALRATAYMFTLSAYAQVGVRPYLDVDLWGYGGNDCGDADGDGTNEVVNAATIGLEGRLNITGEVAGLGKRISGDLASFGPLHIGFWDLIPGGSSAIRPMLVGPASTVQHSATRYALKMRPCWPYPDAIDYELDWADGPIEPHNGSPQDYLILHHTWSLPGTKTVSATAKRDARGRMLNAVFARSIVVNPPPAAQFISQSVPDSMYPGGTYSVSVTMRNNGTTWSPGVYFLGSQSPAGNLTWGMSRVPLPQAVEPGQEVTFTFNVIAPSPPSIYAFQWQMLQDGVGYFGDATPLVNVEVAEPPPECNQSQCVADCERDGYEGGRCNADGICVCLKSQ